MAHSLYQHMERDMPRKKSKDATTAETVPAIKGFNADLTCRDFQFEIGKKYEHDGDVSACHSGFHAIEGYPLEVFDYYAPSTSRYCDVILGGAFSRHESDSKIAASKIILIAEISMPKLIERAVAWVFERADRSKSESTATGYQGASSATGDYGASSATGDYGASSATGNQGASSATGPRGASSATGYQGASSATGNQGASSATGDYGASSATGYQGASSATGYQGAASSTGTRGASSATGYQGAASSTGTRGASSATGDQGASLATGDQGAASAGNKTAIALAAGFEGRARGITGAWIVCAERDDKGNILTVLTHEVDGKTIKENTFYMVKGGKWIEA
jgi:hypothetical protein